MKKYGVFALIALQSVLGLFSLWWLEDSFAASCAIVSLWFSASLEHDFVRKAEDRLRLLLARQRDDKMDL